MSEQWTGDLVAERLATAAATLARSRTLGVGPSPLRSAWPTTAPTEDDRRLAYGYNAAQAPRILPTAAELDALDAVLGWTARYLSREACGYANLASDAGWIAWERAQGLSLPRIVALRARRWATVKPPGGNSREAVRTIAGKACDLVAAGLTRDRVPLHVGHAEAPPEPVPVATGRREAMPRQMDTRRWRMNLRPCGECSHMATARDGMASCRLRGGAVTASMRAQHPEGQPCWEAKRDG